MEDTNTGRVLLIAANTVEGAKLQARRQDPDFDRLEREDPDSFIIKPATAAERAQYQEQQKDQQQDSQDLQQRVSWDDGTRRYRVTWTEFRNGQETPDSMNYEGTSPESVIASVRRALEYQGRSPANMQAVLAGSSQDLAQPRAQQPSWDEQLRRELSQYADQPGRQREYQIYHRSTNQPVVAFRAASDEAALARLEQYRQQHPSLLDVGVRTGGVTSATRNQVPPGEFTGNWQIWDNTGRLLHTFGGIGNNQADANRAALRWLTANGYSSGTEVEVTPEMR